MSENRQCGLFANLKARPVLKPSLGQGHGKSLAALVSWPESDCRAETADNERMQLPDLFIALVKQSGEDEAFCPGKARYFRPGLKCRSEGEKLLLELTKQENGANIPDGGPVAGV